MQSRSMSTLRWRSVLGGTLLSLGLLAACVEQEDDALGSGAGSETMDADAASGESESETGEEQDPSLPSGERPQLGGPCEQTPEATGIGLGKVVPNVVGVDQWGESIDLYADLCDKTVLLIRAGFDCGECNMKAPVYGEYYDLYGDQGFVVLSFVHDYTQEIGVEQQNLWANAYELAHPVVADNEFENTDPLWPGNPARPLTKLLGPGAVVIDVDVELEDIPALFE